MNHLKTVDLLEQTRQARKRGGDRRSETFKDNNVTYEKAKRGNSNEYALKRLRRYQSNLHRQVVEGKLSVNQAMIQAGYRKQPVQVSRDVRKTAALLKSVFAPNQLAELITLLQQFD